MLQRVFRSRLVGEADGGCSFAIHFIPSNAVPDEQ
jgi:hypothetical protein